MTKRTLRDGTIIHQRDGNPATYVPAFSVEEGTDTLELLHPEREAERLRAALAESEARSKATINGMVNRLRLAEKVCHAVGDYAMANTQTVPFVEPRMLDAHAEWRAYVHREPPSGPLTNRDCGDESDARAKGGT